MIVFPKEELYYPVLRDPRNRRERARSGWFNWYSNRRLIELHNVAEWKRRKSWRRKL